MHRDQHVKALFMAVNQAPANSAPNEPAAAPLALADQAADPVAAGRHKVLLVEDHDLVRMGVKALFSEADSASIDWIEASTLADALRLYGEHTDVAVVLLDLNLADCKGLHGLSQMLATHAGARVLILSGTQDEFVVRQAKAMGAAGYLHKGGAPDPMRETLRAILELGVPGGAAPARPVQAFPKFPSASSYDRVAELGARHLEILELVLSGCTNQEISNSTKLSLGTVKNYVSTILLALDVKSRSHLISLFR
jgi:DNA-binding NarL/FixJ family response regulator